MLQKIAKDRRDKVLSVIETSKMRFPVGDIHKVMGGSKGTISDYINGVKPISENWYSTFLEHFEGNSIDKPLPTTKNEESLHKLIDSNAELVITNKKLTDLLEKAMFNSGTAQPNDAWASYMTRIAQAGVGTCWETLENGLITLGRIAHGDKEVKIKSDKLSASNR